MVPEEVVLRDGGLLAGDRERALILPCGSVIAVSETLLNGPGEDDARRSIQGVAQRHMTFHEPPQQKYCVDPGQWYWFNRDTDESMPFP